MRSEQRQFGEGVRIPENGHISPEVQQRVGLIVETAKQDAFERTNGSPEALLRVENAIERRFRPYVLENEIIAQQITSPEYEVFIGDLDDYLQGRIGAVDCDDGRITNDQIGDPRVVPVSRRLQGLPEVRRSTKDKDKFILNDPDITASMKVHILRQERKGVIKPFITEFFGPHILSTHSAHGCGKAMAEIMSAGGTVEVGMWDGGINDYFNKLGEDGFEAFNNTIEILGGQGATFDMTHDAYSQGLTFGLKDARDKFSPQKTLRQNLEALHHSKDILMTELLDARFYQQIMNIADSYGFHDYINLTDVEHFGRNSVLIGRIALEITKLEEQKGFEWIPAGLIEKNDERAVRALGYVAVRNVVRRVMGNIRKGDHELMEHPEQLIRIGPIGANNNIRVIPFIHHASSGRHNSSDIADVTTLNGLLGGILQKQHGVDFREEGRIITTTGIYERDRYADDNYAEDALEETMTVVGDNAAKIRERFQRGVENGEIIVIGCLHEPKTSSLVHIAK